MITASEYLERTKNGETVFVIPEDNKEENPSSADIMGDLAESHPIGYPR